MTNGDLHRAVIRRRPSFHRRHPLAFAAYMMVLMTGLIFITGWLDTGRAEAALFVHLHRYWIWMWEYELLLGGAIGLLAVWVKPRMAPKWPDLSDLLHFEAIGAFLAGAGVTTYVIAIATVLGWHSVGPSAVILGLLSLGLGYRAVQALYDARQVERLGAIVDAVRAITPEQLAGTDDNES